MKTRSTQTVLNGMALVRKKLGLTQQQFADHLEISRSMVLHVERGIRSFSVPVLIKIANLEIKLAGDGTSQEVELPAQPVEQKSIANYHQSSNSMLARELKCKIESRKLSNKLKTMMAAYEQTSKWLRTIEKILNELKEEGSAGRQTRDAWWYKQQEMALKKLTSTGLPAQALLRNKIALLDAEAEINKNIQKQFMEELPKLFY